jgi:FKBP-type peptidyl-prolyl cis-trans isomerase
MRRTLAACVLAAIGVASAPVRGQDSPSAGNPGAAHQPAGPAPIAVDPNRAVTTPSGLVYEIVRHGSGPEARPGQHVVIHETTALADGTVHFSTRAKGRPLKFLLGGKQVIDGLDEGVTGMRAGERRKLVVPPKLSKRKEYPEGLSPDATLYYDVELVEIVRE